jgi:hypothetical protein
LGFNEVYEPVYRERDDVMGAKILRWFFFSVVISLVPFLVLGLHQLMLAPTGTFSFSFSSLWPEGELLLISTAIAADSIAEVVGSAADSSTKMAFGGLTCVVLLASAMWYSDIQGTIWYNETYSTVALLSPNIPKPDRNFISEGSMALLAITLVMGLCCLVVAGERTS